MAEKKARRAGQVESRGPRRWLVRVYLGRDADGKRQWHSKLIHGTKKDADAYVAKKLTERSTGGIVGGGELPLGRYLDDWLEHAVKPSVRSRTHTSYKVSVNTYIRPALGKVKLGSLTPAHIRTFYGRLVSRGLAPRTVRIQAGVLNIAMEQAVTDRLITVNPCRAARRYLPRQDRKERQIITPAQVPAFLEAASGDRLAAMFHVLLFGGLRPSEALALRWSDLDGDTLRVQRVLIERTKVFEEPKTAGSRRAVVLPQVALRALAEHRRRQAAERLEAGPDWSDNGLIFCTAEGKPMDLSNVRRSFRRVRDAAELPPIRLYDLRHTSASLLLAAGEHVKVVQERLGHATVTLTLDTYAHLLPDAQAGAAAKLDKLVGGEAMGGLEKLAGPGAG
jgi:integrase